MRELTRGAAMSLDGRWEFFPGDHELGRLDALESQPILVPGLWEAQGHLDLDGAAWYLRRFELDDVEDWWTLRFGAVMDIADVFVNGTHVGSHDAPFTPFELDVARTLRPGENTLAVRVVDPPRGDPEHGRTAHGKQGWANHAYPSRPSLYLTYGGIWQPVTLHRHGPVIVRDVFVNANPDDLVVTADVCNRADTSQRATVRLSTLGRDRRAVVELAPRGRRTLTFALGRVDAARWSPETPAVHEAVVEAAGSDRQVVRYGLRTVGIEGPRILVNGEPYRMRSALVQGFRAEELYAEGGRDEIEEEVRAAQDAGFNTLRLHIKAFDPAYLDVCDELGMLLHCDIPVAEPVDYDELGADTTLARRCVTAAREQVRRDRNHPSIVLWTAMNEIGDRVGDARQSPGYEAFARTLYAAVRETDPTRPVIENDWMHPDPRRVFCSPIVTAHWYGRLHRDWLDKLERRLARWADLDRVFLLSEYGDWGLPEMPEVPEVPFWDTREVWTAALAQSLWPGSVDEFVAQTQRYQGLSDRMQTELFRRHDRVAGYCLTELTDVPHELNGLLDIHRNPKPAAVAEMRRANQVVLPMLDLRTMAIEAGAHMRVPLHVANDGPALSRVEIRIGAERVAVGDLAGHRATSIGDVGIVAPDAPGPCPLELQLTARGRVVAENSYPLHAVSVERVGAEISVLGSGATAAALEGIGARLGERGPIVVGEDALTADAAPVLRERVGRGETVVVLAQPPEAARWYPTRVKLWSVETRSGTGFLFTTDASLSAFPVERVLAGEDATVHARAIVTEVEGHPFPEQALLVRYNPRGTTGTIVGEHAVGPGRLVFCQYALAHRALAGDAVARALLADVVRLAVEREPRRSSLTASGRVGKG